MCVKLFPNKNKQGSFRIESPETNRKKWVKGQGGKTNQSETSNKFMMNHSLRKEASALQFKAVQGDVHTWAVLAYIYCDIHILHISHMNAYCIYSGLTPDGVFFNQQEWKTETLVTHPISGHVTILDQENLCHWGGWLVLNPAGRGYWWPGTGQPFFPSKLQVIRAVSSTIEHSIAISQSNAQSIAIS